MYTLSTYFSVHQTLPCTILSTYLPDITLYNIIFLVDFPLSTHLSLHYTDFPPRLYTTHQSAQSSHHYADVTNPPSICTVFLWCLNPPALITRSPTRRFPSRRSPSEIQHPGHLPSPLFPSPGRWHFTFPPSVKWGLASCGCYYAFFPLVWGLPVNSHGETGRKIRIDNKRGTGTQT